MRPDIKKGFATGALALVVFFLCWLVYFKISSNNPINSKEAVLNQEIPEAEGVKLLKDSLVVSTIPKNYSNFALRLSAIYFKEGRYDSAARYQEQVALRFPNEENWTRAGLTYYKAFENASGSELENKWAQKAIDCLSKGVNNNSSLNIKHVLAKLYLAKDRVNDAVVILKNILAEDPSDEESLYLLGIHYFQVNELEEASDYLNQLVQADSTHVNGVFYLAVCQFKLGNKREAKMLFEKVKLLDSSEEVKANADTYLNDIK